MRLFLFGFVRRNGEIKERIEAMEISEIMLIKEKPTSQLSKGQANEYNDM